MTNITHEHISALFKKGLREDNRDLLSYRKPITIETGVSSRSAEGSARVKIGDTEVVAGVKLGVDTPYPDTPDRGNLIVTAELIPLSSSAFESGPPSIESIELSRVVDRGLRESECVDFEKLCITAGEKVWTVFVDIYPLNDDGNLFDAAFLAALAAIKDARFPSYNKKDGTLDYDNRTSTPLPLHCMPISVTVIKIVDKIFVDPSMNEWNSHDARLTVVTTEDGNVCALQKGGEAPLTVDDVHQMIDISLKKGAELRKLFSK